MLVCTADTVLDQKAEFKATWKDKEVAQCCITWFQAQRTVHVWFAAPGVYNKHAVTTFQKYDGQFEEVRDHFFRLFQEIVYILMPVIQGRVTLDMVMYQNIDSLHPCVAAILRCLIQVKKKVKLGVKKNDWCKKATRGWDRVDDSYASSAASK